MHMPAESERNHNCRVHVYRTDGSNRMYEASCSDLSEEGIRLRVAASFVVGEVVALAFATAKTDRRQRLARVLYRTADHYGLYFLSRSA